MKNLGIHCVLILVAGLLTGCWGEDLIINRIEVRPPVWQVASPIPPEVRTIQLGKVQDIVRETAKDYGFVCYENVGEINPCYSIVKEHQLFYISVINLRPNARVVVIDLVECGRRFFHAPFARRVKSDLLQRLRNVFGRENVVVR